MTEPHTGPLAPWWKDRTAVVLLALFGAAYLAAVNDLWAVRLDSGLYLSLGRGLAEGRGMEFNQLQAWGIPPMLPLMIAASRLLVGDHFWLLNLAMSCLAMGVVLLAYLTVRLLLEDFPEPQRRPLALAALVVVGTSARLFVDSRCILTDVPFMFWLMAGLYAFVRGRSGHWAWSLAGCLAIVVATATRLPGLVLLVGVGMGQVPDLRRPGAWKRLLVTLGSGAVLGACFVGWALFVRARSAPESLDYLRAISEGGYLNFLSPARWAMLLGAVGNMPSAVTNAILDQKLHVFNILPTALALVGMAVGLRRRQYVPVMMVAAYCGSLILLHRSSVAGRYFMPVMPLLVYFILIGAAWLAGWAARRFARPAERAATMPAPARWAVIIIVAFCIAVSVPKVAREIYWMRHPRFYEVLDGGQWLPIINASEYLRTHSRPETDLIATPMKPVVYYLTGLQSDTLLLGRRRARKHFALRPKQFVATALQRPYRYLVIPTDVPDWSEPTLALLEQSGAFGPPQVFGNLKVFERPSPPPPQETP